MRILRSADYKRMPWKNGKGETVEIAVFPPDATVDAFDWRISMATVAEDGPFSLFDGIDRTLSVLTGDGILLSVEGHGDVRLDRTSPPFSFPGDVPATAHLLGAPITDLNVMTRRGCFRHEVEAMPLPSGPPAASDPVLVLCLDGEIDVAGEETAVLQALDCAMLCPGEAVSLAGRGQALLIRLVRC